MSDVPHPRSSKVVLAKLNVGKVLLLTLSVAVIAAMPAVGPLTGHGTLIDYLARKPQMIVGLIFVFGVFVWLVGLTLTAYFQILFAGGAGVYLSDGRLVSLSPFFWSVRTQEIVDLRAGAHNLMATSLVVTLASGKTKTLNLGLFEMGMPIASRLRELCPNIRPRESGAPIR